jgi:MarR family transcriptional regulator, lower aerobic nicotinate degradation pathway regulator
VAVTSYKLEDQVGFIIRKASQKHATIFLKHMPDQITPTQWAALVKIAQMKSVSQNQLGRETAMDVATIKGVVDRLIRREFVTTRADPDDNRKNLIEIAKAGEAFIKMNRPKATIITEETLKKLTAGERQVLVELLRKLT